jgi:hypothetical protein
MQLLLQRWRRGHGEQVWPRRLTSTTDGERRRRPRETGLVDEIVFTAVIQITKTPSLLN